MNGTIATLPPTDPGPNLADLAGSDQVAAELLQYALEHQGAGHAVDWQHVLSHIPPGCRGAVDHYLHLLEYAQHAPSPEPDMQIRVRLGIVEVLWRLRHTEAPCLTSVALADSLDDVHAAAAGSLLCTGHRTGLVA